MAKDIKIHIGSYFDAKGVNESSRAMSKLANEVKGLNDRIVRETLRASAGYNKFAADADKAVRGMGGGYKTLAQQLAELNKETKQVSVVHKEATAQASFSWMELAAKIHVVAGAVKTAAGVIWAVLKESFKFETQTRQFKMLLGSIDEARDHMKMLKELGDTPPFNLDQFAAASRALMIMTNGALGAKQSLVMVGDAAAATGVDIQTMGYMVGRLYSLIRDGQPIERAALQLRNFGVITPAVIEKLRELQKAGASNSEIWQVVENSLGKYKGAMDETAKTGDGLVSIIGSKLANAARQMGDGFADAAKNGMQKAIDQMDKMEKHGIFSKIGSLAGKVVSGAATVIDKGSDAVAGALDTAGSFVGSTAKAIAEGDFKGAIGRGYDSAKAAYQYWDDEFMGRDHRTEIEKIEEDRIATHRKHQAMRMEERQKQEEDAKRQEELAKAQVVIDEKNAEKRVVLERKANEDLEKLHEIYLKAVDRMDEESAAKARKRMEEQRAELAGLVSGMTGEERTAFERSFWLDKYRGETIDSDAMRKSSNKFYAELFNAEKSRAEELDGIIDDNERKRINAVYDYQRKYLEKRAAEEDEIERKRLEAEKEIAEERRRADEEEARRQQEIARARMDAIRAERTALEERKSAVGAIAANAQSEFDRAFAWYRDPAAAARGIGEEQSYHDDLDRLHRDASRYGGKWRVDELSALMAAGDTQGVSDTLAGWRKSSKFTPQVEAMVRASAAEMTKTTAEDELRKIAANTQQLSEKLDELLQVKGD